MSEEQNKSRNTNNNQDNILFSNENLNFKNNTNNTKCISNLFRKKQHFFLSLILFLQMINLCLCTNELATNLDIEFQKIASNYPSNWKDYFYKIESKVQLKLDKFPKNELDRRLMIIHRFKKDVVTNMRSIVWEDYTIFKTFSFSVADYKSGYFEYIGAARVINNLVEIVYIEIESRADLKPLTVPTVTRECRTFFLFLRTCDDVRISVPRGYTLGELDILQQSLKANSYEYLHKITNNVLYGLETREFVLSENSPIYSDNGVYFFLVQDDGNMVIYQKMFEYQSYENKPIWASGTYRIGKKPYLLAIEKEGEMILYDSDWTMLWVAGLEGKGTAPFRLLLTKQGILTLVDKTNFILWRNSY